MQTESMPLGDALRLLNKSSELKKQGKLEEADRLFKQVPMEPWLAKWIKSYLGAEFLIKNGYNLADADAEFGQNWLIQ